MILTLYLSTVILAQPLQEGVARSTPPQYERALDRAERIESAWRQGVSPDAFRALIDDFEASLIPLREMSVRDDQEFVAAASEGAAALRAGALIWAGATTPARRSSALAAADEYGTTRLAWTNSDKYLLVVKDGIAYLGAARQIAAGKVDAGLQTRESTRVRIRARRESGS